MPIALGRAGIAGAEGRRAGAFRLTLFFGAALLRAFGFDFRVMLDFFFAGI